MPIFPHNVSSSTFVYHNDILDTTFFGAKKKKHMAWYIYLFSGHEFYVPLDCIHRFDFVNHVEV